jgi:hypothetical protein
MRFLTALLALAILLPLPADAQHGRRTSEREREGRESERCKATIEAAGDAYHLVSAARKSAIKRWQEQAINAHGERFINYDNARGPDGGPPLLRCNPARVGGGNTVLDLKRCVVIARPCREPNERDVGGTSGREPDRRDRRDRDRD